MHEVDVETGDKVFKVHSECFAVCSHWTEINNSQLPWVCSKALKIISPSPAMMMNVRLAVKWNWYSTMLWSPIFVERQPQWVLDSGPVPSTQLLWGLPEPRQAFPLPPRAIAPLPSPWIPIQPVYHVTKPIQTLVSRSPRAIQNHWTLHNLLIRPLLLFSL